MVTIPLYLLLTLVCTLVAPLLFLPVWILSLVPATRGALATSAFVLGYLWCGTVGLAWALYNRYRYSRASARFRADFEVQSRWATTLKEIAEYCYRLRFTVHGQEFAQGNPPLILPRHASIADTVLPVAYIGKPQNMHIRYVLKRELLFDPCLDLFGHRLPNYFIDRSGQDSYSAVDGVAQLTKTLGESEGLLIFPEGTRFSRAKHKRLLAKPTLSDELRAQLQRWPDLLPPKLGGTLAMLEQNPGRDLLFMAHVGFEGSSSFASLLNGSWLDAEVHIVFWRIPYAQIPQDCAEQTEFLFTHWDRMQETVAQLQTA